MTEAPASVSNAKQNRAGRDLFAQPSAPQYETRLAQIDAAVCGGLFQPLDRKVNRQVGSERLLTYQKEWFILRSAYRLGGDDLAFFLVLVAAAGRAYHRHHRRQDPAPTDRIFGMVINQQTGEAEWQQIIPPFLKEAEIGDQGANQAMRAMFARGNWVYLRASRQTFVHEAGLSKSQTAYKSLADCLSRLSSVTLTRTNGPGANARRAMRRPGDDLIAYSIDEGSREVHVLLNNELVAPIVGSLYVPVHVSETRELGHVGRVVHLHLCAAMKELTSSPNKDRFDLVALARAVYAERDEQNNPKMGQPASTIHGWCNKLRHKALGDTTEVRKNGRPDGPGRIADLPGWEVHWPGGQVVTIVRPPRTSGGPPLALTSR